MAIFSSLYETTAVLNQYLLFHYGDEADLMPYSYGPQQSLHFPVRSVRESLQKPLSIYSKALEIGCAVGRSSFELSCFCHQVTSLDSSSMFIEAAKQIQKQGHLDYHIYEEGAQQSPRIAKLPSYVFPERVKFVCQDVMEFSEKTTYDIVLAANVLCRIADPIAFLKFLPHLVCAQGQLILISPYSWSEEFSSKEKWLQNRNLQKPMIECIKMYLEEHFFLERVFDLPFIIREHLRKYQWGISQASIWVRL